MGNDETDQRPPSPPHSNDGNVGLGISRNDRLFDPFTPPRTVRPASRSDIAYATYDSPSHYPPVPQQVYYTPQPAYVRQMQYHTPPEAVEPGIMTRSGKTLGSPIRQRHQDRNSRSPRPRKHKNTKSGKKGLPVIDQPLSILTKDYSIPVRDMGAWVNRSIEERMKEVEKKKGYISRPMNSFMLYRSAYAERVKQFCKENNHQVVSQVTGQSWPMEPPHIREMYEQYAIVERDNHATAHPTYKFAPNKSGKKRGRDDDDSDSDDEWKGPGSSKRSRPSTRDETRSVSSTPFDPDQTSHYDRVMYHQPPQPHPSSYQAINPHGPTPFSFGPDGWSSGMYRPQAVTYGQYIDDVKFGRSNDPFAIYDSDPQLIGMPDGDGSNLLDDSETTGGHPAAEQILDPRLADFEPGYIFDPYSMTNSRPYHIAQGHEYDGYPDHIEVPRGDEQIHPGMATLTEGWPHEIQPGSDFDNEFQKWN